jgi:hypothetical protein
MVPIVSGSSGHSRRKGWINKASRRILKSAAESFPYLFVNIGSDRWRIEWSGNGWDLNRGREGVT